MSGSVPSNHFNKSFQEGIHILYPQGWGFFTKDVREETPYAHILSDEHLRKTYSGAFTPDSFYGLSRWHRTGNLDLAILLNQINTKNIDGTTCILKYIIECSHKIPASNILKTSFTHRSDLCGTVIIERRKAHPYSYRDFDYQEVKTTIWKLEVQC